MSDFTYQRLSGLDQSFLVYEGPNSPMHVGAVQIFEAGPLRGADGHLDLERLLEYVGSRLHLLPRYRQKVQPAPLGGQPIWVDDPRLNLRYHVRHSRLPAPGDERILKRTCARILEQRLDLQKPLWELWVVEGLTGDRVAIVSKVHHCMVDGISGVDLMAVLMTPVPTEKIDPPAVWRPRRAPTAAEYAASELASGLGAPLRAAEAVRRVALDEDGSRAALFDRVRATARVIGSAFELATPVPFNQPIGPHRRFDWMTASFDELSTVRRRFGGTVNDVVLSVVAGGLRRWLRTSRMTDPDEIDFKVMAPVSVRNAQERGRLGNRVAAWLVRLPVDEPDRLARLRRVCEATEQLKARHEALGTETLTQAVEWVGTTPLSLGARLMQSTTPFNMVVTNVPGPRSPLHLLGARMLEAHPMVPLMGTLGLNLALFSYQRTLSWGFTADWEQVPDLHDLVLATGRELRKLREAAEKPEAEG